jgi:DNA replication licensing factor MCM6
MCRNLTKHLLKLSLNNTIGRHTTYNNHNFQLIYLIAFLYSFLPYLRRSVQNLVRKHFPEYFHINSSSIDPMASETKREFSVAFYGLPVIHRIRELKTDKIGQLISLSGTVTRTTEVRPELVYATFTCNLCQKVYRDVEQQFKYTEVILFDQKLSLSR